MDTIIKDMPPDVVRRTINAQYADCEVMYYCVLALSWELERLERWKAFHTYSLKHLEERNKVSLETLDYWRSWCRTKGVDVQPQEELTTRNLLEHEFVALEHLQKHFRGSEKTAASHGIIQPEGIIQDSIRVQVTQMTPTMVIPRSLMLSCRFLIQVMQNPTQNPTIATLRSLALSWRFPTQVIWRFHMQVTQRKSIVLVM